MQREYMAHHTLQPLRHKLDHAQAALLIPAKTTYTTEDDITHWLSVREVHLLASTINPCTTWAQNGNYLSIVGIPTDKVAYNIAWKVEELRNAIRDNYYHVILQDAHYFLLDPAGLSTALDNALLSLENTLATSILSTSDPIAPPTLPADSITNNNRTSKTTSTGTTSSSSTKLARTNRQILQASTPGALPSHKKMQLKHAQTALTSRCQPTRKA